jgi:hypothetical protein
MPFGNSLPQESACTAARKLVRRHYGETSRGEGTVAHRISRGVGRVGRPSRSPRRAAAAGAPARVPLGDLLAALTFHVMQGAGSLGE